MSATPLILTQREILLQTTGLDRGPNAYRNCFVVPIGDADDYQADEMADAGLMTCELYPLRPNHHLYKVTHEGLERARYWGQRLHSAARTSCSVSVGVGRE